MEVLFDDGKLLVLSNLDCSITPQNECISVGCKSKLEQLKIGETCSMCGNEANAEETCRTCRASEKITTAKIFSISTSQQGREEDYEIFLSLIEDCGGKVTGKLVKTEVPPPPVTVAPTKKKPKQIITGKDLAELMNSLDFSASGKHETSSEEVEKCIHGVELKSHQLMAVEWMRECEHGKFGGGILADDMGMVWIRISLLLAYCRFRVKH